MGFERDVRRLLQLHLGGLPANYVNVLEVAPVVGDGIIDDTVALQSALTYCSDYGKTLFIPPNTSLLVTRPLFMWGESSLVGFDHTSRIYLLMSEPYALNFGLRKKLQPEAIWTGTVSTISFHVLGGYGRILFPWRSDGSIIEKNKFYLGSSMLGPISSGNNNTWLLNGDINGVRTNIKIIGNEVYCTGTGASSEGIGLNQWDGAEIAYNKIDGIADDGIGLHFCNNISVHHNEIASTDGRLFISQCSNVTASKNKVTRIPSRATGEWQSGIALLYIGHENNVPNNHQGPTNITAEENELIYPPGSIDTGAAIYVYGPRNVVLRRNIVRIESELGTQVGMHVLPFVYSGGNWTDPAGLDTDGIARVRECIIDGNNLTAGFYSGSFRQTGALASYHVGPITITNNRALSYSFLGSPATANNTTRT